MTDFGLAKQTETESRLTHSGQAFGTPSYIEQMRSVKPRSARSIDDAECPDTLGKQSKRTVNRISVNPHW